MFDQIAFGEKLKSHRKLAGMTQEEAAEKIGVSGQAVSKWEKGECLPDCYNLKLLGKIYRVSVDSLLDTDEPSPEQVVDTIIVNGAVFEIIEKPDTVFAGKIAFAAKIGDGYDFVASVDEVQKKIALDKVICAIPPERGTVLSINFWLVGSKLHGMGFVRETSSETQPDGVDVYKNPASLYVRAYTDNAASALIAKEQCEPWELFAYIRNHVMPAHGYKMAENGAQEIEVYDSGGRGKGFAYVPVMKM